MSKTFERWKYELTPTDWVELGNDYGDYCVENSMSCMSFTEWLEREYGKEIKDGK